jgi:hypothetical protein
MQETRTRSGQQAASSGRRDDHSTATDAPAYDLLAAWEEEPHPAGTVALCNWLAGVGAPPWPEPYVDRARVVELGRRAAAAHASRPRVLLALGRMFLAWRELSGALTTLVRAATLAPRDPLVFRLLGEVLFRRGDVTRAARVFDRAIAAGATDADTRAWADAAHAYLTDAADGEAPRLARRPGTVPPPAAIARLAARGDGSRPPPPHSMIAPAPAAGEALDSRFSEQPPVEAVAVRGRR